MEGMSVGLVVGMKVGLYMGLRVGDDTGGRVGDLVGGGTGQPDKGVATWKLTAVAGFEEHLT